jgi:bifunctional enzyme CysN/CysC
MHGAAPQIEFAQSQRDQLRFVACGSVDDGKSTLVGRLLAETGSITDDQLSALSDLTLRYAGIDSGFNYALLLDGLEAEREQGITIDVAYRYFATQRRCFVVADTPGHEQYIRNTLTGASNAELALLLVDVRHGVTTQTKRVSRIVDLLGVRHVLLAVNKMDLVEFSEAAFAAVAQSYREFATVLGFATIEAIPISAKHGDNVGRQSERMPWHRGPTVLGHLEAVDVGATRPTSLRYLVQSVIRAEDDFRGYAGIVAGGEIARGDTVAIARTGNTTRVRRIVTFDGDLDRAETGRAVTLTLADPADIGRGDVLVRPDAPPQFTDQFAAHLVWLDERPLLAWRSYMLQIGTRAVPAVVTALKHKIDIETGARIATRTLETNEIGLCNLSTSSAVALDPYADNAATGGFILVDRDSAATVGVGMARFALHRADNIRPQVFCIDKAARAQMKAQRPVIVWFTGLSGAGKSTIMNLVERRLGELGVHTYALDGDNLRRGLNRDLGFADADRVENIRRAGEVARLMVDAGLIVLCAFISPFRAERRMVRELVAPGEFIEVFVDTPLAVCMSRDPKALYAKAQAGGATHVTGLDSPYEAPEAPELVLSTTLEPAEKLADRVVAELRRRGLVANSDSTHPDANLAQNPPSLVRWNGGAVSP